MTVVRYADPPLWRIIVTDTDGALVTILDHRSTDRTFTYILDAPAVHSGLVASDDPEINIPYPDPDSPAFLSNNTRLLFGLRREPGATPAPSKVLRADGTMGDAFASFDFASDETDLWVEVDVFIPAATLASWTTFSGDFVALFNIDTLSFTLDLFVADVGNGLVWATDYTQNGLDLAAADAWHTLKFHAVLTPTDELVDLYVDGALSDSGNSGGATTDATPVQQVQLGIISHAGGPVYFDNIKVGTTEGGSEVFADNFESGDFSAWTATSGDVSVVDDPAGGSATAPYICRYGGIVMQCEDVAADTPTTRYTAYDPWQLLFYRPARTDAGALPGADGITYTDARPSQIAYDLLANTVAVDGPVFIDASDLSLIQDSDILIGDFVVERGASVGEIWQRLCDTGYIDIILRPVYDPRSWGTSGVNVVELIIRKKAGSLKADAVFAWDLPGRSIVEASRMVDGTRLINTIRAYAGQGGNPVTTQTDATSIAKYGVYWSQPFYVEAKGQEIVAESLALDELETRRNGQRTLTFSPAPEFSPLSLRDYGLGDYVPVWASRNLREPLGVDYAAYISDPDFPGAAGYQRVFAIPIELDDNGVEHVRGIVTQNEQNS